MPKESDFKNIIFDFGGVLMDHNLEGCLQAFRRFMSDADIEHILGLGNKIPGTLRAKFETKSWNSPQWFVEQVLLHSRTGTTEQQVIDAWNSMHAGISSDKWQRIKRLHSKGNRIYLLSNTDKIHWEHTMALYQDYFEQLFDAIFLSFNYEKAKPDPSIFKEVNRAIHANPLQTYFVDDSAENRVAAEHSVGWIGCADFDELEAMLHTTANLNNQ